MAHRESGSFLFLALVVGTNLENMAPVVLKGRGSQNEIFSTI